MKQDPQRLEGRWDGASGYRLAKAGGSFSELDCLSQFSLSMPQPVPNGPRAPGLTPRRVSLLPKAQRARTKAGTLGNQTEPGLCVS